MKKYLIIYLAFILSCGNSKNEILVTHKNTDVDNRIEVVLLGTWHFSNPGADEFNTTSDNFLAPHRQKQIDELNQRLAKFNPDKIFIENKTDYHKYFDSLYQTPNFDPMDLPNDRGVSESFQIGYKLGKILHHKEIYGADADGLWLGSPAKKIAKEQYALMNESFMNRMKVSIDHSNKSIKENTITDVLIDMNHPDSIIANNEMYLDFFARVIDNTQEEGINWFAHKGPSDKEDRLAGTFDNKYVGAELVAEWYKRNIKIYSKIIDTIDQNDKRIFVLFGAGHIRILKHLFEDSPRFKVVEVNQYLKG